MTSFCCRRKKTTEYENIGESYSVESSLVSNRLAGHKGVTDDLNIWSNPHDMTHTEAEDDAQLVTLLEQRDNATTATGYQMASDHVERIRTNRRKIRDRWKSVLRELGFENEDELTKLVTVTPLSHEADGTSHFSMQADSLHSALARDTMIFGNGPTQRNRYATVLSRLIDLDTADDFVGKARELYPRLDPDVMSDLEWDHHPADLKHSKQDPNQNKDEIPDQNYQDQQVVDLNHQVLHYDNKTDQLEIVFESSNSDIERE
ncbi:melanoregulin-like [Amphiura filiformis]|uniref:melanoregulin-like n=1 Tax=Amphiura filiformis TaxID=82378 RepID=UPI003B221143